MTTLARHGRTGWTICTGGVTTTGLTASQALGLWVASTKGATS